MRPDVLDQLVSPWLGKAGQTAFYRQIAHANERYTDEIEPLLGSLDLPVLVCWGDADEWLPAERGNDLPGGGCG